MPWPLDTGGHLRSFHLLRSLAHTFRVTVVAGSAHTTVDARPFADAGIDLRAVPLGARTVVQEAWRLVSAAAHREPYVCFRRHDRAQMAAAFSAVVKSARPDIVYFDHLDSILFASQAPGIPAVVDLHNVYSSLVRRTADEADGLRRAYLKRESTLLERVERRAAAVADLALVVSDEDAEYYRRLGARIRVVPNGVDCDAYSAIPAGQRVGLPLILYVGSLSWGPNASAARYLVRELLPRVRQTMPDVRARVIGRNPPDDLLALGARSGVEVLADVDRIQPHLREAHVVAVPLDAGGGSRLKILEAFAAGVPVVSTPVGCEGLTVEDEQHLLVAPRERLADAVVRVLRDRPLADRMAIRARDLARRRYDWRAIGADAAQAVAGVVRPAARG